MAKKKVLTKSWYQKLQEELRVLKEEKLPAVLARLKEAIAQWDISENAAYEEAQAEKDKLEIQISELEDMLKDVEIIEDSAASKDEVWYGSVVKVLDIEKDKEYTVTLVWGGEVDVLNGKISVDSPLGSAIGGKKVWEEALVRAPQRRYKVKILEIK